MAGVPDIAFDELLAVLEREGFALEPGTYVEFTAIFRQFTGNREQLKYYLAPIVCRNREEQERFYSIYDRFVTPDERPRTGGMPPHEPLSRLDQKRMNAFLRKAYKTYYFLLFVCMLVASGAKWLPLLLHPYHDITFPLPVNPDSLVVEHAPPFVAHPHGRVFVVKANKIVADTPVVRSRILERGAVIEKENSVHSSAFARLLVLGLASLALSLSFFPLRRSRLLPRADIDQLRGDESPLDIPILPKDHLIQGLPGMARMARRLVQPLPTDVYRLEINQTIRESIRAYGLLTPVYEQLSRRPEYLFLIDRRAVLSCHVLGLVARGLARQSVQMGVFFHGGEGVYYPLGSGGANGFGAAVSLYQVEQRYAEARVIRSVEDLDFIPEFDFGPVVYGADIEKLREWLGDEDLFQWVCAAAVYPTVRWEVLLAVGAAVLKERKALDKLNILNLLRLGHISWLEGGSIPGSIRLALLKALGLREELVARQAILELLKESDGLLATEDPVFEEKMNQVYTQSFILFANRGRRDKAHEEGARKFLSSWNRRKATDMATILYLTNPDRQWDTPVRSIENAAEQVGANQFIDELLARRVIHNPRIRAFFRHLGLTILFILFLLFLFKDSIQPLGINKTLGLVDRDYPDRAVTVVVPVNACLKKMVAGPWLLVTLVNYDNNSYSQLVDISGKDTVRVNFGEITMAGKEASKAVFRLVLNKQLEVACTDTIYYSRYELLVRGEDCGVRLPRVSPGDGRRVVKGAEVQ